MFNYIYIKLQSNKPIVKILVILRSPLHETTGGMLVTFMLFIQKQQKRHWGCITPYLSNQNFYTQVFIATKTVLYSQVFALGKDTYNIRKGNWIEEGKERWKGNMISAFHPLKWKGGNTSSFEEYNEKNSLNHKERSQNHYED